MELAPLFLSRKAQKYFIISVSILIFLLFYNLYSGGLFRTIKQDEGFQIKVGSSSYQNDSVLIQENFDPDRHQKMKSYLSEYNNLDYNRRLYEDELKRILNIEKTIISIKYEVDNSRLSKSHSDMLKNHYELFQLSLESIKDSLSTAGNYLNELLKGKRNRIEEILNTRGHFSVDFNFRNVSYRMFAFDMSDTIYNIGFHLQDSKGFKYISIQNLLKSLSINKNNDVLMITNGGMYHSDNMPQGLFIENSREITKIDLIKVDNQTNFYMFPNGVFFIDSNNVPGIAETFNMVQKQLNQGLKFATQSGPMLVIDGQIHKNFKEGSENKNIRSGVGIPFNYKTKLIFIISDGLVNFYDFASVFKDVFGCSNALYLDGFVSKMFLKDIKSNVPVGNFGPLISVTKSLKNE